MLGTSRRKVRRRGVDYCLVVLEKGLSNPVLAIFLSFISLRSVFSSFLHAPYGYVYPVAVLFVFFVAEVLGGRGKGGAFFVASKGSMGGLAFFRPLASGTRRTNTFCSSGGEFFLACAWAVAWVRAGRSNPRLQLFCKSLSVPCRRGNFCHHRGNGKSGSEETTE